ncbi:MAG: dienelactone hydrolase family protein [Sphingobacteriales bacterium]|nr:MAG: dienelactone hydrolase family protein [Sphingobacteriales bacterium]
MVYLKNIPLAGKHGRPILSDVYYHKTGIAKPVVIFSHGFKGFKDWGAWHIVAQRFADAGFVFVLFNFSYNGTTPEKPEEFADLEAFGNNNYSIELDDLGVVLDWITGSSSPVPEQEKDNRNLFLTGHSRGGGITILKANEDPRIKGIATWAGVCSYHRHISQGNTIDLWREKGVIYISNARTKQEMPLYFQLYENTVQNMGRLNIEQAAKNLNCPLLIIHGTTDPVVLFEEAQLLHQWHTNSRLLPIPNANHVFGMRHPWESTELPADAQTMADETIRFFKGLLE